MEEVSLPLSAARCLGMALRQLLIYLQPRGQTEIFAFGSKFRQTSIAHHLASIAPIRPKIGSVLEDHILKLKASFNSDFNSFLVQILDFLTTRSADRYSIPALFSKQRRTGYLLRRPVSPYDLRKLKKFRWWAYILIIIRVSRL